MSHLSKLALFQNRTVCRNFLQKSCSIENIIWLVVLIKLVVIDHFDGFLTTKFTSLRFVNGPLHPHCHLSGAYSLSASVEDPDPICLKYNPDVIQNRSLQYELKTMSRAIYALTILDNHQVNNVA
jgi:hypothetical protein